MLPIKLAQTSRLKLLVHNKTPESLTLASHWEFFQLQWMQQRISSHDEQPPKHNRAIPISFYYNKIVFGIIVCCYYWWYLSEKTLKMPYRILRLFTTSTRGENLFKFDIVRYFDWREQTRRLYSGVRQMILKFEPTEESYEFWRKRFSLFHYQLKSCLTILSVFLMHFCLKLVGVLL